ncbi:AglZ/HisF2 family acetamidino modification protein [Mesorhizobium sp. Z1-4]|uniref:AglZ/HisF2 family acetamidino modification protein n=1 Tax=Mesorhizobium sp. Z1-4 TaxID=2448478 RepID=UPI000FDBFAA8|nr:AglZ/HisF2 family acetamidino modification protein [Mesorhizobium sp. Z1-4]
MKLRTRIIPLLLLKGQGLYKTRKFRDETYIGDPINAVRIFNEKAVDELGFLDIGAARNGSDPNFDLLKDIASECFMPLSYGGGVKSVEMVRELVAIGIEKIVVNSAAWTDKGLITRIADHFGSSTVVGSIDVKRNWRGKEQVMIRGGQEKIALAPVDWALEMERRGVGEIMINAIDRDGEMTGYDLDLVRSVAGAVSVPVIAAGGASSISDLQAAVTEADATAAAGGAMFVFQGKHRAVLITYPTEEERAGF